MVAGPAEHSWSGVQRAEALWSPSAEGEIFSLRSAPQGVNFKTVQWTVLKEGTPCKRGRPLEFVHYYILVYLFRQTEMSVYTKTDTLIYFFPSCEQILALSSSTLFTVL